jgi:superfamily II DNA or RNA helicase
MLRGVYYDGAETRSSKTLTRDGLTLTLTDSQLEALDSMSRIATQASRAEAIPMFLSAETGAGKTEVGLNAALLFRADK